MEGKQEDLLMKYSGKTYPPLQKQTTNPQLIHTKKEYQAVVEMKRGNRVPRFKIVTKNGTSYGCSYAHVIDWVFTPHDTIIITTSTRIFTIEGKQLEIIERTLMEERLKEIHEFNNITYQAVKDDAPLIELINVTES